MEQYSDISLVGAQEKAIVEASSLWFGGVGETGAVLRGAVDSTFGATHSKDCRDCSRQLTGLPVRHDNVGVSAETYKSNGSFYEKEILNIFTISSTYLKRRPVYYYY